jgi:hypothetical protein
MYQLVCCQAGALQARCASPDRSSVRCRALYHTGEFGKFGKRAGTAPADA